MEPVTVNCTTGSCTVTHIIQIELPPFQLTAGEGAEIAGAILAVWALAWGFRVLIQTLKHTDGNSTNESDQ